MALADSALRFADQIGFKVGYAEALMLKGSVYRWTVNEAKGLEYYYQALRILRPPAINASSLFVISFGLQ